jgi:hypothetical protein
VPEDREAREFRDNARSKTSNFELNSSDNYPEQSDGDMEAVRTDKGKERGKERASLGTIARGDEPGKFRELKHKKRRAQNKRDHEP